jgi:hypothetical protein
MSGIGPRQLRIVERWTLIVAAVVVAAATLVLPRPVAFACAVGAGLECANAWAIRVMVERAMKSRGGATPGLGLLLFNAKMAVLVAMVAFALFVLRLDGVGFVLGISVFPVALVAAALSIRLEPGPSTPDAAGRGAPVTPGDR